VTSTRAVRLRSSSARGWSPSSRPSRPATSCPATCTEPAGLRSCQGRPSSFLLHARVGREGFGRGRLGRSRKRPDEIAAAYDADEGAVAYHRKSPDLSVVQDRGGGLDPECGTDDQGRLRHDLTHAQADDLLVAARQVFRVLEEEAPPGRDLRPALAENQVAVADDADD